MKPYSKILQLDKCVVIVLHAILLFLMVQVPPVFAENATEKPAVSSDVADQRFVSIDFNNVDINVFIKFISELTGQNFVVDDRVKGKVTIISPAKISLAEAFKVFESVLEVHGYTTVKAGEITKIVPSPDARSKNIKTLLEKESGGLGDKIVTQLIHLKFAGPNEIKQLFTPLISKSSVILSYPPTNTLIVTDVYSNIKRLQRILETIDIPGIGHQVTVIPIEYADSTKLVKILDSVFQTTGKAQKGTTVKTIKFVADERTNTIILLASEVDTERVSGLIKLLDRETPRGQGSIHVYYLENAAAEDLASVLQELPGQKDATEKGKKVNIVSEKVKIKADKATNSLIIMAEKEDYLVLEDIIKKLDIPRAMVYIEALIMEVNVDKDFRLGTEWVVGGKTDIDGTSGIVGGGFSGGASGGDAGYDNISLGSAVVGTTVSTLSVPLPGGFSMGVMGEAIKVGNLIFPSISAVIQAYKKDKDVQILSTPQILTTDNEKASITVGKNVPYQTKSAAEGTTDTYSSYEYKDVGKTLEITPQISKDRMIRLVLKLTVETLESTTDNRPTTLKRTMETTVLVKDKNTVVLGGLIDDTISNIEYKVPCLGDIPLLEWMFKSKSKGGSKTNLYIFLTPKVIETEAEAKAVYEDKMDHMNKLAPGQIKMYNETTKPSTTLKTNED